jgi:HAD superfamily hydrolase (TIGR01509 family)
MDLRALLFDMDGTLVATDDLHFEAWVKVLGELWMTLERPEYNVRMTGRPNREIMRDYFPHETEAFRTDLMTYKENVFLKASPAWEVLPGLHELLAWAVGEGLARSLVTSAPRDMAGHLLRAVGLEHAFSPEVYASELPRGKPDPLPYTTALELLALQPGQALVFEDALSGVRSSVAAGIFTVGVATTQTEAALREVGASLVIRDFTDEATWVCLIGFTGALPGVRTTVRMKSWTRPVVPSPSSTTTAPTS